MKVFSGGRGIGKTRDLIEYAFDKEYTIVCQDPENMLERIYSMGYATIKIISYEEYIDLLCNRSMRPDQYVIDDIETFLKVFSRDLKIKGFTVVC